MEHLWAPWRMEYIEKAVQEPKDCVFCGLLAAQDDAKNLILYRGKTCFALLNKFPYNPGHMLVLPLAHKGTLEALTPEESLEFLGLAMRMRGVIEKAMSPQGFNLGINLGRAAGAGVPDHIHIHLVPRWTGDCNFMPVLADVKVLPQALRDTYHILERTLESVGT